jgi:hypothetical protein
MVSGKGKIAAGITLILFIAGATIAANSSPDVSIGQNGITINTGQLDMTGNVITGLNSLRDQSGDDIASVNDNQNSLEMQGGFKLPTGEDAYN